MRCATDEAVALVATYWGSEWDKPCFDLLVDGVKIANQQLDRVRPGDFYDVAYAVPVELTRGKASLTVRLQPHASSAPVPIYGLRVLRAAVVVGDQRFVTPDPTN